ncbi:hypothetical protein G5I_05605 [Acromyrmex echinatior]|uniref:Uncharacterized protein n=1 Tax=Acromyrmex echinatior TaxID=103372 RepID=F4WIT0_ACREC|nr:hypothetical protein G5I_05605 [Acromyrmex echinatior]
MHEKGCRSEEVAMKSVHEWGGGSTIAALADIAGTTNYPVLPGENVAQRIEESSVSAATRQLCICHASLECMCIQPALEMSRNLFHDRKTKMAEYTKSDKVFEMQVREI